MAYLKTCYRQMAILKQVGKLQQTASKNCYNGLKVCIFILMRIPHRAFTRLTTTIRLKKYSEKGRSEMMTTKIGLMQFDASDGNDIQCDQIGRIIKLWATFKSLLQQLICPNLPHSQAIFVKV